MRRISAVKFILFLSLCFVIFIILGFFVGKVNISPSEMLDDRYADILRLRLLRIILAIAAGAGLSLSGVILQAILRNPLAEPYILGISSGSGFGAVIGLLFFSSFVSPGVLAFIGGILTIVLVCRLAKLDSRISPENMIISGILVNAFFSSLLMFFISNASSAKAHSVIWWLLGNLQVYKGMPVVIVAGTVVFGFLVTVFFSKDMNAMSLGEEEAMHLGVNIERVKKILLLAAALVTSVIVSTCGIIGFVGLMIPHIVRRLLGPDHRGLVVGSFLMGGLFLLLCDIGSRLILTGPSELPIGVVTAFIGVPFFVYILRKSRKVYFK
ncbi:MAG: iron ABC transporter permease [Candidatus Omnitrophica bacterium]|nr:iron ABC transporter permease [Candidatus Omnitrophota bacterium]MBU4458125.1 iron ABC transporter permease [Candidatus Omnitrophota bacterium]